MINVNTITRVYFLGIGGIGMSAIAKYFNAKGAMVSGYDKTPSAITRQMEKDGIAINYEDSVDLIDKKAELVVFTPAVPKDHLQLNYYINNNYPVVKRSDVLGEITKNTFNIAVAGTHGKTTISTMIAHILRDSGYGANAFLGGIAVNYQTNFWSSNSNTCVVEADEYDRSFLKLQPDIAVISAMDADHLDIYGTEAAMEDAFIEFSGKIKKGGLLIHKFGLRRAKEFIADHHLSYSLQNDSADAYAANITMKNGAYQFDVLTKSWMVDNVVLKMGGMHNVENTVAAITVAKQLNIQTDKIKKAVESFKGVKRRFEYVIPFTTVAHNTSLVFVDDYAHHPEELKALITGAKTLFPNMTCTIVFQPHLFSRTKDFAEEFARALDLADHVMLLPIYPARELPVAGVTSQLILKNLDRDNGKILEKEEVLNEFKYFDIAGSNNLVITAGAGDIDTMIEPIKNILLTKLQAN